MIVDIWETHSYSLLGVYVIDPVWESSFVEYDSLLDNTKVQRSNRKALFFKYFQVWIGHYTVNIIDLYTEISV